MLCSSLIEYDLFQSTPSAWRETYPYCCTGALVYISIHSLRMEGDFLYLFYERSVNSFQSTPSAWRETLCYQFALVSFAISIHSLRMEGDFSYCAMCTVSTYFNPLPPHGGRPVEIGTIPTYGTYFNPLPPHGGRQLPVVISTTILQDFNPLPPHGGRHVQKLSMYGNGVFQSTPSAWRETHAV